MLYRGLNENRYKCGIITKGMATSITDFLKITKKKMIVTLVFPLAAVLILLSCFMLDEALGLGGSAIVNAIYSSANYLYLFIFLPLTLVDIDSASSIIFKMALALTVIWWYILSCISVFLFEKDNVCG